MIAEAEEKIEKEQKEAGRDGKENRRAAKQNWPRSPSRQGHDRQFGRPRDVSSALFAPSAAEAQNTLDATVSELTEKIEPSRGAVKPLKEAVDPVDDRINEMEPEWKKQHPRPDRAGDRAGGEAVGLGLADRRRGVGELPGPRSRRRHARHHLQARQGGSRRNPRRREPRRHRTGQKLKDVRWDDEPDEGSVSRCRWRCR